MSAAFSDLSDAQLAGRIGKRRRANRPASGRSEPSGKSAMPPDRAKAARTTVEPRPASEAAEIPETPDTLPSVSYRLPSDHADPSPTTDPIAEAENACRMQQSLELLGAVQPPTPDLRVLSAEAAAYRLLGIEPRDAIEQMLATQMIALHAATMDCARRAASPAAYDETRRQELNLAQKSSRAFAHLVDTLDRRRRGGEQKMTVEHVHVHAGGQAIVGNVAGASGTGRRRNQQG